MDDESRPDLLVIPTELDRRAPWLDLAILGLAIVLVRWLLGFGFNWPVMLVGGIVVVLVALHVLSGEPATDVEGIGLIATGLRSKLGLRRAHEWIIVAARYWGIVVWPVWRANVDRYRNAALRVVRERSHHIYQLAVRPRFGNLRSVLRAKRGT